MFSTVLSSMPCSWMTSPSAQDVDVLMSFPLMTPARIFSISLSPFVTAFWVNIPPLGRRDELKRLDCSLLIRKRFSPPRPYLPPAWLSGTEQVVSFPSRSRAYHYFQFQSISEEGPSTSPGVCFDHRRRLTGRGRATSMMMPSGGWDHLPADFDGGLPAAGRRLIIAAKKGRVPPWQS
jgi:hypothetical protein